MGSTRRYTHLKDGNGNYPIHLVSWVIRTCERCGRFLKKFQGKDSSPRNVCPSCSLKREQKYHRKFLLEWRHRKGISKQFNRRSLETRASI